MMKKALSTLLAALTLISFPAFGAEISEADYQWDEVQFFYDFELDSVGSAPSAQGNIYQTGTPEWTIVTANAGSCVIQNERENKVYRFTTAEPQLPPNSFGSISTFHRRCRRLSVWSLT